ncbi:MAG: acetate--CoA ligase family protein [Rhodospirillaceae bacterium]|nr:acetate--CoA ligase family protein [Rhodospirillaceae bacterium]
MDLQPLFEPSSVAVLGASTRPSVGGDMIETLKRFGFAGGIYPVNPKYDTLLDLPCYPSLTDLPAAPDIVAFCVGPGRIPENFRLLPDIGAKAAVIFGGGYAEEGEAGQKIQAEIVDICQKGGIALCGPNCMGVINPTYGSATYLQLAREPDAIRGNVGLISQSGSICISLLSDVRRFGFSLVASSGNEAVVNAADYLEFMVDHDATKVIAMFTETIADPERYVAALDRAADKGKPVIVLKVGKAERSRQAITTHTGGLAGDTRMFSEVLRAHRAIEVDDLDEFVETIAACQGTPRPHGNRLGVITSSGGMAELILDRADDTGLQLPALPEADMQEAVRVIGAVSGDGNPLDAWGNGDFNKNTPHGLKVVRESDANDAVVLCYDNDDNAPLGYIETLMARAKFLRESAGQSDKPHYQMTMRPGLRIEDQIPLLREAGVPTLFGVRQGLQAIDRLSRWTCGGLPARSPAQTLDAAAFEFAGRKTVNEHDSKQLIARFGVRVTEERIVTSATEAVEAARSIGFPVVMKAASDDIAHKTEHGLVKIGLADDGAVEATWVELQSILAGLDARSDILVQEMVSDGIEVFAGVAYHEGFGHALAFGMGGIEIEVTRDFALRMLPLRDGDAEAMMGEIRAAARLGPLRGQPGADTASLATVLYALSDLVASAGPTIQEIDLNPIKVLPEGQGCVVVDALIVPAPKGE